MSAQDDRPPRRYHTATGGTKVTTKQADRAEALERLHQFIKPGDTIYCIIRSVSRSGMSRCIDFYARQGDDMRWITPFMVRCGLADMTYETWHSKPDSHGMRVNGGGMDMGFHCVYNLGRIMFPDGFGVFSAGGIRPTSREHAAELRAEGKTSFYGRNGDKSGWDTDGGYALKHRWL